MAFHHETGLNMVEFIETVSPYWRVPLLRREPIYCPTVFSEINLSSFLGWVSQPDWDPSEFSDVLDRLVFVLHRIPDGYPNTSPLERYGVRTAFCKDVGCTRCSSMQGGYQFRYVSSLFTPSAAFAFFSPDDAGFGEGKAFSKIVCTTQHFPVGGLWTTRLKTMGYLDADSVGERHSRLVAALEAAHVSRTAILDEPSFQAMELRILESDRGQDSA